MRAKQIVAILVAVVLVGAVAAVAWGAEGDKKPAGEYVSVIYITGTIGYTDYDIFGNELSPSTWTILSYIDDITYDENNRGIFLAVDSGGGAVYDSDKIYQALMEYKEYTGRPIKAACASSMCSGAYYIACAADTITAERTSDVGSIGVYIELTNIAELCDKLGVSVDYIRSSENKAMGSMYQPLTEEQRAIYQAVVDEHYERFLDIVQDARGYDEQTLRTIADGRTYTATMALENGLIDEIMEWDDSLWAFEDEVGVMYEDYIDVAEEGWFSALVRGIFGSLPKSELQLLEELMENGSGEVLYYAP